jgi:hypothetical protein
MNMTELEKKEISEIVVETLKSFLESIKPMPVPVSAETMSILYSLYTLGCPCPPPRCCPCPFPPPHLSQQAKEKIQAISGKIGISEEEVLGLVEQRIRKDTLAPHIDTLISDLGFKGEDLEVIDAKAQADNVKKIDARIRAIRDKIGLTEEHVLSLAEQKVRKQNVESEIDTFAGELGI